MAPVGEGNKVLMVYEGLTPFLKAPLSQLMLLRSLVRLSHWKVLNTAFHPIVGVIRTRGMLKSRHMLEKMLEKRLEKMLRCHI